MGKWCKVFCSCENRRPLSAGKWPNYDSYRRNVGAPAKPREFWENNIRNAFECGHRSGIAYETWPGDILRIGSALERAFKENKTQFPIFRKLADFSYYDQEVLEITFEEVKDWAVEVGHLKDINAGRQHFPYHEQQRFFHALNEDPFLYGDLAAALQECERLIDTCRRTGNGILFSL